MEPMGKLLAGLLTGLAFGFLLQKGRAAKYEVIIGQLLRRDWTVVKLMGTAVVVGAIGVHALVGAELASLHVKPAQLGGVIGGAVLFGIGMAILGLCPGTTVAALGEGRRDALAGVAGMFAGAAAFVLAHPAMKSLLETGNYGKATLHELTDTSPWCWVGGLAVVWLALFAWSMKRSTSIA